MKKTLLLFIWALSFSVLAQEKVLKWGGDSEGGAPFIFQNPDNPEVIIGFEVDLVNRLAQELGMTPEFVQNQWDGLVPGLNISTYDIVVNGLEITEDRKEKIFFSDPYYYTFEQIVVRQENQSIHSFSDLKGKKVGTLKASLAERMLTEVKEIEVRSYDSDVNSYEDLANGRLDAVFLDAPIAIYHGTSNPKLKIAGEPVGKMAYGIGVRKNNPELLLKVNAALDKMKKNGELRKILENWNLWNPMMEDYLQDKRPSMGHAPQYEAYLKSIGMERTWKDKLNQYISFLPLLAKGAVVTLKLSILGMVIAMVLGLIIGLINLYAPTPFNQIARLYIEVVRGTPLLIQLFFIFYGLPNVGIQLDPFFAAILGLGLNYAAYEAENYRAGIMAIPPAQMEAASALGMTRMQSLRHIIIPQALRLVVPPVTNDFISLIKDSSLVSVITMVELTKVYGQLAATYYDYFGIGLLAAAMYFFIGLPFVRLSRYIEKHFSLYRPRPS